MMKINGESSWTEGTTKERQEQCRKYAQEYAAAYRAKNREQLKENHRKYYRATRDELLAGKKEYYIAKCEELKVKRQAYVANNRERVMYKARMRARRLKEQALLAYGGPRCVCCGETEACFLSLDHINNDGATQRKIHGSGGRSYSWLKTHKYPPGLRVLCFNCNLGRHINGGICPHEKIGEVQ